jgi:hypothetical protein
MRRVIRAGAVAALLGAASPISFAQGAADLERLKG